MQGQGMLGNPNSRCARLNVHVPTIARPPSSRMIWRHNKPGMTIWTKSFASEGGESMSQEDPAQEETPPPSTSNRFQAWFQQHAEKSKALRNKLIAYGPAAVLAYGLFDGVSYSIAFAIAFLGYEAKTGLNPTANVADIVKICILMWAGNNVTRPFRLAGAAALAPWVDKVMEKLKNKLHLPNKLVSFFILTFTVAAICLSGVGALIFSRWIQG